MYVPARSAAAMSSSPGRASTGRPSTLMVTVWTVSTSSATDRRSDLEGHPDGLGVTAVGDVGLELGAEALEGGGDGRHRRRPERADRRLLGRPGDAGADVVADVEEQLEVARAPAPGEDPLEDLLEP